MAYYLVLGEVPANMKLDFVKFNFSENVMMLRNAIYDKKKYTFSSKSIDENGLILWKVDIPFDGENDKLRMLDETFDTINIKRDLKGKEMLPGNEISKYLKNFDKPPRSIHILVQPPSPLSGKCLSMVTSRTRNFSYHSSSSSLSHHHIFFHNLKFLKKKRKKRKAGKNA
jgi:hypothetical protein